MPKKVKYKSEIILVTEKDDGGFLHYVRGGDLNILRKVKIKEINKKNENYINANKGTQAETKITIETKVG